MLVVLGNPSGGKQGKKIFKKLQLFSTDLSANGTIICTLFVMSRAVLKCRYAHAEISDGH